MKMSQEVKKEEEVGKSPEPTQKEIQEQNRKNSLLQKQAAADLAAYKKRLRESVELKRLQVEELELNVKYFEVNKEWKEMQPEIEEFEAQERAERQKQQEDYQKMIDEAKKKEGGSMEAPGDIVVSKQGKPRSSTKKKVKEEVK